MASPSAKVVYILPGLEFGGATRLLSNLLAHSDLRSLDVVLLAFKALAPFLEGTRVKVIHFEDLGVSQREMGVIWQRMHIPLAVKVARRIASRLREERADVVVGFIHIGAFLLALAKHFLPDRPRCLASLHGPAGAHFDLVRTPRLRRMGERLCLAYLCWRADGIIVPSEGIRRDLIDRFGVSARKIQTVHNGIDLEGARELAEAAVDWPWSGQAGPVILGVGRLAPEKGFDTLVRAFAILRERIDARLLILGKGPLRGELERLASESGVVRESVFGGFRENPFPYMRRSTVFVLPSYYEGFGYVLLEAMACGVPVVATDCPTGPGEIVHHGDNGLLVPVADPAAMASAIERVLRDPELRDRLVRGGAETAEAYSIARTAEGYERVFLAQAAAR